MDKKNLKEKDLYEKPKYKLIKPVFEKFQTTTISSTSVKK